MRMLLVAIVACLVFYGDARYRDEDLESWDYPINNDPQASNNCLYNCNSGTDSRNRCVDGECACAQGFKGKYCTCEGLCDTPFGKCNDDEAGTCTCTPNWKGRNCNCPVTCPDAPNWKCKTGDTVEERGCICRVDNQPWFAGKNCCPKECRGLMNCPKDNGECICTTTNENIPYGSPPQAYKCCPSFCYNGGGFCECRPNGCYVRATGLPATKKEDCSAPAPGSCQTPDSWQECSIVHWQGRCVCAPGQPCACKCWYGWGGGNGVYALPGWDNGFKALYTEHCRNRCDWTHQYQPTHCSTCTEAACPDCLPPGAKKCAGTF